MKALDKIYVREFNEGINQMWSSVKATETTAIAQHEYIRKDALLEWANARKAGLSSGESFVAGERKMLKEIINKIESL